MRPFIIFAVLLTFAAKAKAETFPVIQDPLVLKECGDCHMAFPPQTLTRDVWHTIMGSLSNHFGEDASLDAPTGQKILSYLTSHASDVSDSPVAMKWTADTRFSRITEAPRFVDVHGNFPPEVWAYEKIKTKSNCQACHATMQTDGSTEADMTFLPKDLQAKINPLGSFGVFIDGMF